MPIRQNEKQHNLSLEHIDWLKSNFNNILDYTISLDSVFKSFEKVMSSFQTYLV